MAMRSSSRVAQRVAVEDVALEEGEERFHGGVVAGGADLAHGPDQAVTGERPMHLPGRNWLPRSEWTMQPATSLSRRATAISTAATTRRAFMRESMAEPTIRLEHRSLMAQR